MRRSYAALVPLVFVVTTLACAAPKVGPVEGARGTGPGPTESVVLASAPRPPAAPVDESWVDAAVDRYVKTLTGCSPETATSLGLHDDDARLDDRSPEAEAKCLEVFEEILRGVEVRAASAGDTLSARRRIDVDLLRGVLRVRLRATRERKPLVLLPTTYTEPFDALFAMVAREYAPPEVRARNVLARLAKLPDVVRTAKVNVGAPPKVFTEVAIERASSAKAFLAEILAFLDGALPGEKTSNRAAVTKAEAAYADYAVFLKKTVLPRSTGSFAIGKDLFEFMLREAYFVDTSADDLHAMGRATMAKTISELEIVAKRIDPTAKSWVDVVANEKKKHPTAPELLPTYRKEVARARAFLAEHAIVSFPEGDDLEVIETPVFLRSTLQAAYDQPPPFDPSTKGFFFVTPVEPTWSASRKEDWLRESDFGDVVDTAVHEAYPGHHLQLSFARRHPSKLRKIVDSPIFSEGWALYCEEMMNELGYYRDGERLMQLEWTLVRAARVVIDVGLHTRGLDVPGAVRILTDEVHLGKELATNEVKRYTMSPTQPLAYLTGREALFALRERAKKAEGAAFTLKRFHDQVLSHGSIPPGLVARELYPDPPKVR
ncbi:MAG: DUF885 domain-containing protein [Polyangiaceae bacterium]